MNQFYRHVFICVLTICILVINANSQQYSFRHYGIENGLSYNAVNCCLQDKEGFLWFGTSNGLNRFDGHSFKIYRNVAGIKNAIGNNYINSLYQDGNGNIWIGTHNGLYRYDKNTESFDRVGFTFTHWVTGITADNNGNLWLICGGNICRYNIQNGRHVAYPNANPDYPNSIICTRLGEIWTTDNAGNIRKYDAITNAFINYNVFNRSPAVTVKEIRKLYNTGQGSILIGTADQGLKLFDVKTATYRDVLTKAGDGSGIHVNDIVKFDDNSYWIASNSGIYIYNSVSSSFTHLSKNSLDPGSLTDNNVNTLFVDNERGVWAGTTYGGINYYNQQNTLFENYAVAGNQSYLNKFNVQEICGDAKNNSWFATPADGLYQLNTTAGQITPRFNSYKTVSGLLVSNDTLWLGKGIGGLDMLDVKSGRLLHTYPQIAKIQGLKINEVVTIHKTRKGAVVVGTTCGLYLYNSANKGFDLIKSILLKTYVSSIFEDHNGNLWVGSRFSGLFFLNMNSLKGGAVNIDVSGNGRFDNTITSIYEDDRYNIWLSTESAGIVKYDPQSLKSSFFTTLNGLPTNNTLKILGDDSNRLWISTSAGLCCFNITNSTTAVFTKANGLPSDQFNANSGYRSANGKLYFGSNSGIIGFDPAQFSNISHMGPLCFTGIQVDNKELLAGDKDAPLQQSVVSTSKITLPYSISSLSVDFASLSYIAPEMTRYAYKMDGLDKTWTYLNANRKAYFSRLAPGQYTFRVKSSSGQGSWSNQKVLLININPPWWLSKWAYFAYACAMGVSMYLALSYYKRRTKEKNRRLLDFMENEKDKELYKAKIDFFTNITHEIRTPLTLIAAPLEKIINANTDPGVRQNAKLISKNTNRLIDLTNQLLDFRKMEGSGIKLNFVKTDVNKLLIQIFSDFDLLATQRGVSCSVKLPEQVIEAYIDQEAFVKIATNLIQNAIKYSESKVLATLKLTGDSSFVIEISNDGVLIPENMREKIFDPFHRLKATENQEGTGIGLSLARALTVLHQGEITVHQQDKYNVFRLELPIHQDVEFEFGIAGADLSDAEKTANSQPDQSAILLVEDNLDILNFLNDELRYKYHVHKAVNGRQALDILHNYNIQLVISDVMMPVMDGFELCRQIKTDINLSHVPVMLLTAKNAVEFKIEGLQLGADVYIEKPFSPAHIVAQANSLLTNRFNVRRHFYNTPLTTIDSISNSKTDDAFLNKFNALVNQNIANPDLDVDLLAGHLNMSRRTLYRKITAISDISPAEMIDVLRLKKAAELLLANDVKVFEIAGQVGFKSRGTFTRNFIKQFGYSPTDFIKQHKTSVNPQ